MLQRQQLLSSAAHPPRASRVIVCSIKGSSSSITSHSSSREQESRRAALLQLSATTGSLIAAQLTLPGPGLADDLGRAAASGFVGWWKSRRTVNGGAKLLAPIYVARQRLQQADDLLSATTSSDGVKEVLQLVRASSLNCYMFEALEEDTLETRASLLTQKLELSDPCTFRIVLKNTVDLEPPAVQEAARGKMEALVLSYQMLDDYLDMARQGNTDALPKAQDQLKTTMLIAADIEDFVKATLGV